MPGSDTRMSREEFLHEAGRLAHRAADDLARIHGEAPCMYAVEIVDVAAWPDTKREEELARLRGNLARAEARAAEAQAEREALWKRSAAASEDRAMPPMAHLKSIREDLSEFEDVLGFVRSRESAGHFSEPAFNRGPVQDDGFQSV